MAEKLKWLRRHGGDLRRLLMLEPRGHAGMHGAMLTEPMSPKAHAGLLSMHAAGFPLVSGESIIGAVTIALEHKLIEGVEDEVHHRYAGWTLSSATRNGCDGCVRCVASGRAWRLPECRRSLNPRVSCSRSAPGNITVDIAFGGEFYAIADSEAIGIPIEIANADALVRMGREIKDAIESTVHVQHPVDDG